MQHGQRPKSQQTRGLRREVSFERPPEMFDLLSSRLKSKLGEILQLIADEEQTIEIRRQELARVPGFEPYSCFTRIDRSNQGVIYSKDIV